jgi:hypothetical protein
MTVAFSEQELALISRIEKKTIRRKSEYILFSVLWVAYIASIIFDWSRENYLIYVLFYSLIMIVDIVHIKQELKLVEILRKIQRRYEQGE